MTAPLAERLRVRGAVVALIRALMAEAGIRPRELAWLLASSRVAPTELPAAPTAPAVAVEPAAAEPAPAAPRAAVTKPARQARPPTCASLGRPSTGNPHRAPAGTGAALVRAGRAAVPGVVAKARPLDGEAIVPDGVRVTVCPSGQDMRYRVDPAQPVEGAGFMAEWRRRRGE